MSELVELNNEYVQQLFSCEKNIVSNPNPRDKSNSLHTETGIEAESVDGQFKFYVFMRQHVELVEHFSVGLIYQPEGGKSVCLKRYNGNHGAHKNFLTGEVLEDCCHIHEYNEGLNDTGIAVDNHAQCTDTFSSIEEARKQFFDDLNFVNYLDFYPELAQDTLGI